MIGEVVVTLEIMIVGAVRLPIIVTFEAIVRVSVVEMLAFEIQKSEVQIQAPWEGMGEVHALGASIVYGGIAGVADGGGVVGGREGTRGAEGEAGGETHWTTHGREDGLVPLE